MARSREFDEDEVIERAMRVFWRRGYRATSLTQLLEAMRLSKSSFYEAFGTKRDLLLTAIRRYAESGMGGLIEPLQRPDAGRAEIEATLRKMVQHARSTAGQRGCLVNNCISEVAPHDRVVFAATAEIVARLERLLIGVVTRAQARGEIDRAERPRALARFLANTFAGINLAAKSKPEKAALDDVVRVALRALG
jgi:TetR/AcrR family transcriptional regulator, transcriptional repressor for nem operon